MFAKLKGISDEEFHRFIGTLHREVGVLGGVDELIGEVGTIAIRLWTSAQTLQNRELCSIFNEAIREDYEEMMPSVVVFAKGLNMLCITRRMVPSQIRFAEKTYRGGALPQQHHSFFEVGKQFRTPQFLSSSKNQRVAYDFARKASERGEEPVLWEFVFHPILGCDHVNFLERANVEGEEEFLFTAYSVFKVLSQEIKSQPRWTDPHKIVLEVAPDNRDFPEDLPLSPWFFFLFLFFIFYFLFFIFFFFFFIFIFFLWTHISCLGLNLQMVERWYLVVIVERDLEGN